MGKLSTKLDELPLTVDLCMRKSPSSLAVELLNGKERPTVAVGSGGSAVSAEYFSRCRETCGFSKTVVETPMQFTTDVSRLSDTDVWLFTAGGDNADIKAAVESAYQRGASRIFMITRNSDGQAAVRLRDLGGKVYEVPVADQKDGYLATHSLAATVTSLLLAFDALTDAPFGEELATRFNNSVREETNKKTREKYRESFARLLPTDTLILLSEPQLSPVSTLIDTSVWEAALCNIQSTDFRNFSHGRHTWLHHRANSAYVVALTGRDWQPVHSSILSSIPPGIRQSVFSFGNCGRFENAVGIIRGLVLVEAMGDAVQVDPGKPGVGSFGRDIFEDSELLSTSFQMHSAARQKYAEVLRQDFTTRAWSELPGILEHRLNTLRNAKIGALVLDYDGTVVRTEARFDPPESDLVEQIFRLRDLGVKIAIASGRGGSVGEDLRKIFDAEAQKNILIGYYNGAYLQNLDVNIDAHRPEPDSDIDRAIAWMKKNPELFHEFEEPKRGVQIAIQKRNLVSYSQFEIAIRSFLESIKGQLRLDRSAHSYDLVVERASKLNVVQAIKSTIADDAIVLCLGDSGAVAGNDYELVCSSSGISVDAVCCEPEGTWSLFGYTRTGPLALRRILSSLVPAGNGCVRFASDAFSLDN